ncbi:hypothetical protein OV079_51720 [Nannocystis pusilla]|uniref:Uncharacterized protein n=1 Tax=Nannocystis pusilla TaxID=889268 RepID=A0A9X3F128_9BACT|nr:hypothetical protein [Nannocystis pusilla]MCY1013861.1 hypothetical protein [Nannocystis pusilla]
MQAKLRRGGWSPFEAVPSRLSATLGSVKCSRRSLAPSGCADELGKAEDPQDAEGLRPPAWVEHEDKEREMEDVMYQAVVSSEPPGHEVLVVIEPAQSRDGCRHFFRR